MYRISARRTGESYERKNDEERTFVTDITCFCEFAVVRNNPCQAATVKAKVDVKKFYGMAEQVLQEINKQRRSNGLSDLKMDANFTEAAMDIALQVQGGDASASNPDIYNNKYISKDAMEIDNIDGYDMYDDNLWKENRNGTQKVLNHIKK